MRITFNGLASAASLEKVYNASSISVDLIVLWQVVVGCFPVRPPAGRYELIFRIQLSAKRCASRLDPTTLSPIRAAPHPPTPLPPGSKEPTS